mmetsp:Transcript_20846/g.45191  ORF Transcript_20846/g.45191 Transcript_20846/m.45191 type:complete len:85 (+) Transcript_20846:328-582(+)
MLDSLQTSCEMALHPPLVAEMLLQLNINSSNVLLSAKALAKVMAASLQLLLRTSSHYNAKVGFRRHIEKACHQFSGNELIVWNV